MVKMCETCKHGGKYDPSQCAKLSAVQADECRRGDFGKWEEREAKHD